MSDQKPAAVSSTEVPEANHSSKVTQSPSSAYRSARARQDFQTSLNDAVGVGAIQSHGARLWIRTRVPGRVTVGLKEAESGRWVGQAELEIPEDNPSDNTVSFQVPEIFDKNVTLTSLTRYEFVAHSSNDHRTVGQGRFQTAPKNAEETPSEFSIAFMSCHQPFDHGGRVIPKAREMLRATHRCLRDHDVKMVLMLGDQVYSDYPPGFSLFDDEYFKQVAPPGRKHLTDCTVAEIRRLYHGRYQRFWGLPEWQAIMADFPCYPIMDDHDIVDNWGSTPLHKQEGWQRVGQGALQAYYDYQASRVLPAIDPNASHFDMQADYGCISIFVMDLRSNRRTDGTGQLISKLQRENFETFLREHAKQDVLLLGFSVPAIHMPQMPAKIVARLTPYAEDFSDRWSTLEHINDRDWVLKCIHVHQQQHPEQQVILLSGDIHIGCAHRVEWNDGAPPLYQLISSGITHESAKWVSWVCDLSIRLNRRVVTQDGKLSGRVKFLPAEGKARQNPCHRINVGVVKFSRGNSADLESRCYLYGHRGDEPVCVYRSEPMSNRRHQP